ncbi:MAG: ATP synthase F0 subunit C [Elusimicrobia bacterium]|nr:ATP synthase F0 subunit C [Elusimicrobiota bacterium]
MSEQFFLGLGYISAGLGAGLVVLGAAGAIAKVVSAAVEGTARQPEAANAIKGNMQLFIFLIEGLGIVGLGVAYVIALNLGLKAIPLPGAAAEPAAHHDTVK